MSRDVLHALAIEVGVVLLVAGPGILWAAWVRRRNVRAKRELGAGEGPLVRTYVDALMTPPLTEDARDYLLDLEASREEQATEEAMRPKGAPGWRPKPHKRKRRRR